MTTKKPYDEHEMNCLHDVVYDSIGLSMADSSLLELLNSVPSYIISIGREWGLDDTVFRDKLFDWLKNNKS